MTFVIGDRHWWSSSVAVRCQWVAVHFRWVATRHRWSPSPCIVGGLLCVVGGSLCVVGGSPRVSEKWENEGDTYKDAQSVLLGRVAEEARQ